VRGRTPFTALHTSTPADYYKQYAEEEGMDEYTSVFMRMTISNIRQRSPLLWCASLAPAAPPPRFRAASPCRRADGLPAGRAGGGDAAVMQRCRAGRQAV
jgi:hypothetical protein